MRVPSGVYVAGQWRDGHRCLAVHDKYTGDEVAALVTADAADVAAAVRAAAAAPTAAPEQRSRMLMRAADAVDGCREELADLVCAETGKLLPDARAEVARGAQVLRDSAAEATRIGGEVVPAAPGHDHRLAFTVTEPVGVVAAIAPFNAPVVLLAHKLGPALAAGNAVVAKPAPETGASAGVLVELLAEALAAEGMSADTVHLLQGGADVGTALVTHPDVDLISFTGGAATGERIASAAGLRPTLLELGSNSAAIVAEDADLDRATDVSVRQAYAHAGQVCLSVQRLYAHESVYQEVVDRVTEAAGALRVGDPRDPGTDVGPMLRLADADRVTAWVEQAVDAGGKRRCGGRREGPLVWPTVLTDVPEEQPVVADEVFGPVLTVLPYRTDEEVVARVNAGRYGLQAGVFTRDVDRAFRMVRGLRTGGVLVNDGPLFRVDSWPYGGRRDSGVGKEGPRWAVAEMSVAKLAVLNLA